jgi:hypothetical protein
MTPSDPVRVAAMANAIAAELAMSHATNIEAMAALATVFSVRLGDSPADLRAEMCRWFSEAVLAAADEAEEAT